MGNHCTLISLRWWNSYHFNEVHLGVHHKIYLQRSTFPLCSVSYLYTFYKAWVQRNSSTQRIDQNITGSLRWVNISTFDNLFKFYFCWWTDKIVKKRPHVGVFFVPNFKIKLQVSLGDVLCDWNTWTFSCVLSSPPWATRPPSPWPSSTGKQISNVVVIMKISFSFPDFLTNIHVPMD